MKKPAEKLYRVKVVLQWFERHNPDRSAIRDLSVRGVTAIRPADQHHITAVEIKRRFRV